MTSLAQTLQHAQALEQRGKAEAAIKLYRGLLVLQPSHPLVHARLGGLLLRCGRPAQAIASLEQALQAEPAVMGHWVRLLSAYQQSDNMARARDLLEEAIDVGLPAEPLQALAHAIQEPPQVRQEGLLKLYSQGSHLSTEIAARLLMDDYPSHPLGWQILGAVLHDAGKLQEALQVKTETVKLFPNDANAHNNLAFTLLALKQYAQAANSARRALMLSPSHAAAKANEAKAIALMKPVGVMRF